MKNRKTIKPGTSVVSCGRVGWCEPDGRSVIADPPVPCAICGATAIVALPPSMLAIQPDDTTHVCHPGLGGCNHGFSAFPSK